MKKYQPIYAPVFRKHIKQYASFSQRIKKRVIDILLDPYSRTEALQRELKGLRSARIGRNFRVIFAINEEIKKISHGVDNFPQFCIYPDDTIIFITVGPHSRAYRLK